MSVQEKAEWSKEVSDRSEKSRTPKWPLSLGSGWNCPTQKPVRGRVPRQGLKVCSSLAPGSFWMCPSQSCPPHWEPHTEEKLLGVESELNRTGTIVVKEREEPDKRGGIFSKVAPLLISHSTCSHQVIRSMSQPCKSGLHFVSNLINRVWPKWLYMTFQARS